MYVVAEFLILINFLMNAFIIWLTAKVLSYRLYKHRWLIGAFISSWYFILPFQNSVYEALFKILFSWIIVMLVFFPKKIKESIVALMVFYGMSFFIGGGLFGTIFLFNSLDNLAIGKVSWMYLILSIVIGGGFLWGIKTVEKKIRCKNYEAIVEIQLNNNSSSLKVLVDSGNLLKTSTGTPCCVVEGEAVKKILPYDLTNIIFEEDDIFDIYDRIDPRLLKQLKLQPVFFNTVGNAKEALIAMRPDKVLIGELNSESLKEVDMMIAISKRKLNLPEGYNGLLPPGLV
ncbi:sigma-E processing peptidase SpoIIGA [Natranaerofaba carboxydovora]|uniref:sigma-E processing peptidase SpoIIGA n=1 Tax=Natranaerofaba carboxydovora TaxID=2742683 RepID=UPI001F13AF7B|nr:sigma-E processing peptidase SpoIIGA [Natranaerofaba carboxydovora]UMZ73264.1 Sporulation sigma-E factor-processing peptidase [Natranaerofaba carboxydovora]